MQILLKGRSPMTIIYIALRKLKSSFGFLLFLQAHPVTDHVRQSFLQGFSGGCLGYIVGFGGLMDPLKIPTSGFSRFGTA